MSRKSILLVCMVIIFIVISHPQTAFAHKMIIERSDSGLIQVNYDNGTAAGLATVSAFDPNGELLFEKDVDEEGYLDYDEDLDVQRLTADDGMGHRATLAMDEERTEENTIPTFIKAFLGVSVLLFIAAVFTFRNRKK